MSFLPIVDRELRVASRRWMTYLTRTGVGLLAILLSVPAIFIGWVTGGGSGAGQGAFSMLSGYVFVVAMLGGVLITADCLSSEKRDGTLGLLFLTDLRGYDVVLGKFAALGLHSMYGMVAVFPALALPLLTGGVTGGEFWRVSLALLNLLFVSLAVGMAVSAVSREASRAYSGTLGLLLLLVVGIPLGVSLLEWLGAPVWVAKLGWINPGHAFAVGQSTSSFAGLSEYWLSLGVAHAVAWLFLIMAAVRVPGTWQDKGRQRDKPTLLARIVGDRIARVFRSQRDPAKLNQSPMLWLMGERRALKIILWSIAGVWSVCVVGGCLVMGAEDAVGFSFGVSLVILLIFALALVEHSCRFWVESRQDGNLEALLVVPLKSKEILFGHWASIRRHFMWPLVVVLCATTLPIWVEVGGRLLTTGTDEGDLVGSLILYGYLGVILGWFLATFIAIGYTGMWFALKLRRPQFASGLTLLCVVLLPMMFCWLGFGLTLVFIFLPMSLLQTNLRGIILQRYMAVVKEGSVGRS